jgi:mono/diheme cytochrome c family protein
MRKAGNAVVRTLSGAAAASVLLFPIASRADDFGDAGKGYTFALKHCAGCHAVNAGEAYSPHPGARNFTSAAKTSGMTGRALAVWLDTSHPTMPDFILRTEDRDNVIAYILSLRK